MDYIDATFMEGVEGMPCANPGGVRNGQMIAYMPSWTAFTAAEMGRPDIVRARAGCSPGPR